MGSGDLTLHVVEAWRRWLASFLDVGNPDVDLEEAMRPRVPQPPEVLLRRGTQSHLQADVSASQCFEARPQNRWFDPLQT